MAEAAAVVLEEQGHPVTATLELAGKVAATPTIVRPEVTDQMRRTWHDDQEATEMGACATAIAIIEQLEGLSVMKRSRKGTGFDYWLGQADDSLFESRARLEVSGIRQGGTSSVSRRLKEKRAQISSVPSHLPGLVAVVEFGQPQAQIVDA
ncbi:MAG: hypothetical protein LC723_06140 [Actinobacteria bacterium]|nr:hypothetical protein [Actinomycetota bacterium]